MRGLLLAALAGALAISCGSRSSATRAPAATIDSPADGATLGAGVPAHLRGHAVDAEGGPLTGAALIWSSDLDGKLGTGGSVDVALSRGRHTIQLVATDSRGARGTAQITVSVNGANRPPVASIDAPADGASFDQGAPIALLGHAVDPEDGALPGSSLIWSEGGATLGTGAKVTVSNLAPGAHRVLLTAVDREGAAGYASARITVLPAGANHPPTAAILAPPEGAAFHVGDLVSLQGTGSDVDDAPALPALSWSSSLDGPLGSGAQLQTTLSRGAHAITLTATDKQGATGSATVDVSVAQVGNAAPVAAIQSPAAGATFFQGTSIAFSGSASDAEDGALGGAALAWSSSLDGPIGQGASFSTSLLSVGAHQITLTARDSAGDSGAARVGITVLAANQAPVAAISGPADGSTFAAGTTVQLRGSATDPEDGALNGASLTWRSSLDGLLGTGTALDVASLRAGAHLVTLTAVDSGGRTGSASIGLTITPAPVNIPPVARLTGTAQAEAGTDMAFDASESSDADGTIAGYRFDFGDGSSPQDGAAKTATHQYATPGGYTVTLTVTDDKGASGSTTLGVTVLVPVRRPKVIVAWPDALGGACRVDARGAGQPVVAFLDVSHRSLWFATSADGTHWTAEEVDGPGFEVGGTIAWPISLAVAADGTPHLAYRLGDGRLLHAFRAPSGWAHERVDADLPSADGTHLSVGLDPSQSGRPTVFYSAASGVAVSVRGPAGSWAAQALPFDTGQSEGHSFLGGLAFSPAGVATLTLGAWQSGVYAGTWTAAGALQASILESSPSFDAVDPVALDPQARPLLLTQRGLYSARDSGWARSSIETFQPSLIALAADAAGQAWATVQHGNDLELVHAPPGAAWDRLDLGAVDSAQPDVSIDGKGDARVCFFRGGKLLLY
jgi:PKD repeat protein